MDPVLAQALATLIGALTTAILMAASYYWGPRQRGIRQDARTERARWPRKRAMGPTQKAQWDSDQTDDEMPSYGDAE